MPKTENETSSSKQPADIPSVPVRKKATPLDIVGEMEHIFLNLISYLCLCWYIFDNFSGFPGYDRLTDEEKLICTDLRLAPTAFLEYKRILVNENESFGYLRLSDARRLIKIDVNKTREIYNFLIKYGYANPPLP